MRYTTARFGEVANLLGEFAEERPISAVSGVNIRLFTLSDGQPVSLLNSGCVEISGSRAGGFASYYWATSGITTQPTEQTEYLYMMQDAVTGRVQKGKFILGGHPDEAAIASYLNAVWIDVEHGVPGTTYPIGTPTMPVDNLADALTIQAAFSLANTLHIRGFIETDEDLSEYTLLGTDPDLDGITFLSGAITSGTSFQNLGIFGHLAGRITADRSIVGFDLDTVSGLNGLLNRCGVAGRLLLASGATVNGLEIAARSILGVTIDFTAGPASFLAGEAVGIFSVSGITNGDVFALAGLGVNITLTPSCTGGIARVAGVGELTDNSAGTTVIDSLVRGTRLNATITSRLAAVSGATLTAATISGIADQVWDEILGDHQGAGSTGFALGVASGITAPTPGAIADAVWDEPSGDHTTADSTGADHLLTRKHITNRRKIDTAQDPWMEIVYDDDGATPIQESDLLDEDGANINDDNRPRGPIVAERVPD